MTDSEPWPIAVPRSPLDDKLGVEITEQSAQRVSGRAPVDGNTQPYGLWHGGASAVLVETLGSLGAAAHAGPDRHAVGTELNVSHLRSVRSGWVHGVATAIHLGSTSAVYRIELTDDDGRLIASGRLSCRLLG
ncbi:PaaI family thioesterase [Propionimicrobium sp. PCR01-08-3]|uniref:PaaI family thioesterase n=1 Tax=Propionimicrobium sp. PCR01-08-3 TaxID=3052086 RepID=UPI00255C82D6|nr:PaaI family thioesterase [Propionimicrobium sp. PCR01-08-3]WIY81634.1 PaaI family thioesterase [Propionimicrobium sp. PCR01-08-3]